MSDGDTDRGAGAPLDHDAPPLFLYRRVRHPSLQAILAEDAISCLIVQSTYMVIGTRWGTVAQCDLESMQPIAVWKTVHRASVTSLSVDAVGEYVASSSDDGTVHVFSVAKGPQKPPLLSWSLKHSLKAAAIGPFYARSNAKFCIAQGAEKTHFVLHENGWLGAKETVLAIPSTSTVWTIQWQGSALAWCDEEAAHVMDWASKRIIWSQRMPTLPSHVRLDLYRPVLAWQGSMLYLAWANHMRILQMTERQTVTLFASFALDVHIAGMLPVQLPQYRHQATDALALLTIPLPTVEEDAKIELDASKEADEKSEPEMRFVDVNGADLAMDILPTVASATDALPLDYLLAGAPNGHHHMMVLPNTLLSLALRTRDDQMDWYMKRHQYVACLALLEDADKEQGEHQWTMSKVSRVAMDYYLAIKEFASAASFLPHAMAGQEDVSLWAHYMRLFTQARHLKVMLPYLPTPLPAIPSAVVTEALVSLWPEEKEVFVQCCRHWAGAFQVPDVLEAIGPSLSQTARAEQQHVLLAETVGQLYLQNGQPALALPLLCAAQIPDMVTFVQQHKLEQVIAADKELMLSLLAYDTKSDLLENPVFAMMQSKPFQPAQIVAQLEKEGNQTLLFDFLYFTLFQPKGKCLVSEDRLLELCAQLVPTKMMSLLQKLTHFDLQKAFRLCRDVDLVEAQIFLLNRMGNHEKALGMMLGQLKDMDMAIAYVREQKDDQTLWQTLVRQAVAEEKLIAPLFAKTSAFVSPTFLLASIPNEATIDGFRDAIQHVLQDLHLQISLRESCEYIVVNDSIDMMQLADRDMKQGRHFDVEASCLHCQRAVFGAQPVRPEGRKRSAVPQGGWLFLCGHTIHCACHDLMRHPQNSITCPQCRPPEHAQ